MGVGEKSAVYNNINEINENTQTKKVTGVHLEKKTPNIITATKPANTEENKQLDNDGAGGGEEPRRTHALLTPPSLAAASSLRNKQGDSTHRASVLNETTVEDGSWPEGT